MSDEKKKNLSIHPRNWNTGNKKKVNTSKPSKRQKGYLDKIQRKLSLRRSKHSAMSAEDQKGHTYPGSMRLDKN